MALATQPKLLLLDEPMAGMSLAESERMVALLAALKGRYAMLLVEHDMDAVFTLADRISRAGLRPRHRVRRSPQRSAPTPKCAPPTSASRKRCVAAMALLDVDGPDRRLRHRARCCSASTSRSARASASRCSAATAWARPTTVKRIIGMLRAHGGTRQLRRPARSADWPSYRIAQAGHRPRARGPADLSRR